MEQANDGCPTYDPDESEYCRPQQKSPPEYRNYDILLMNKPNKNDTSLSIILLPLFFPYGRRINHKILFPSKTIRDEIYTTELQTLV